MEYNDLVHYLSGKYSHEMQAYHFAGIPLPRVLSMIAERLFINKKDDEVVREQLKHLNEKGTLKVSKKE